VAGPPHPLQPSRHAVGRFHLHDEVHHPHVDPQLEARCGHDGRDLPRLQPLLDLPPPLLSHRAVVHLDELVPRQFVHLGRDPLRGTAVVDEHDRRPVGEDEFVQPGIDRGPDRALGEGRQVRDRRQD